MLKKGFTLIELLVVIAIIGTLTAITVPNLMAYRVKSRDAKRKSDLRSIEKSLELYQQTHSPPSFPSNTTYDGLTVGSSFTEGSTVYLTEVPGDPSTGLKYYYNNTGDLTYVLAACLEDTTDTSGTSCPADYLNRVGVSCSTNKCFVINFN